MDTYVKAVLYVYPRLEKIEKDYEEHIKNKAFLSYDYRSATEVLTEYIAGEIIRKNLIGDLKGRVERALEKLSTEEKFLLELRYFGRKKALAEYCEKCVRKSMGSERNYYRRQNRTLGKISALLKLGGLTEEYFLREYACFGWLTSKRMRRPLGKNRSSVFSAAKLCRGRSANGWEKSESRKRRKMSGRKRGNARRSHKKRL